MARILIVDDEKSIRRTLTEFLVDEGYEVIAAEDVDAAQQCLAEADFDVVVTDIILPRISGIELLHRIQASAPDVQVVMMTGEPTVETAIESLRSGAADYLYKPVNQAAILRVVSNAVRIKSLEDTRRRLEQENQRHRENLERLVEEQTAQLRESEERFRSLYENSIVGLYRTTPDGKILLANPALVRMLGYNSLEELASQNLEATGFHPKYPRQLFKEMIEKKGAIEGLESAWTRKDGKTVFFRESARAICDSSGNVLYYDGVVEDITEHKLAEEQVRKLARAVEQSPVSVIITDRAGNIEFVNPKFSQTSGYAADEVMGKNPRILKTSETPMEHYHRLWETISAGQEWHGEFHNRKKNGELYWEWASISPIADSAGKITHFVAVIEDITERKRMDAQIRQAQKMDAIGHLAGGVAHDFNNILSAILLQIGLLKCSENLNDPLKQALSDIEEEAQRASALTRQLLMFSRRSVLTIKSINLNEVVTHLMKMLRRLIAENIKLSFEGDISLPSIEADAAMIEQVVMNLVVNARDSIQRLGVISVRTSLEIISDNELALHPMRRSGRFACLSISDTGTGMDEATLKRIFEPFFTTKEAGKGTGLGLATVHGIVAQHKGWVEVESKLGKGSIFRVFLPVMASNIRSSDDAALDAPMQNGSETVLLVEDATKVRQSIARALHLMGYHVYEAQNSQEAIQLWKSYGKQIDLLLTDVVLAEGMTGLELAQQLRSLNPNLTVIISSGYSAEISRTGIPDADNFTYLPKPYEITKLAAIIRNCLDASANKHKSLPRAEPHTIPKPTPTAKTSVSSPLLKEDLSVIPNRIKMEIHSAASQAYYYTLLELIQQVARIDSEVSRKLQELVENFDYETLIQLFEN